MLPVAAPCLFLCLSLSLCGGIEGQDDSRTRHTKYSQSVLMKAQDELRERSESKKHLKFEGL